MPLFATALYNTSSSCTRSCVCPQWTATRECSCLCAHASCRACTCTKHIYVLMLVLLCIRDLAHSLVALATRSTACAGDIGIATGLHKTPPPQCGDDDSSASLFIRESTRRERLAPTAASSSSSSSSWCCASRIERSAASTRPRLPRTRTRPLTVHHDTQAPRHQDLASCRCRCRGCCDCIYACHLACCDCELACTH